MIEHESKKLCDDFLLSMKSELECARSNPNGQQMLCKHLSSINKRKESSSNKQYNLWPVKREKIASAAFSVKEGS